MPPAEYKYQRMQKGVGELCGFIDIKDIYEELGLDDYCLVFDDEFLLNGRPVLNPIVLRFKNTNKCLTLNIIHVII